MLQRAQAHDSWMRANLMPAGGVMSAQFTDGRYIDVSRYAGRRDPAIWTGTYLAVQALRHSSGPAPETEQDIAQTLRVLHRWWNISGDPGYLARFAAPADSPAAILATLPADDPEVVRDVAFEGGTWHWRGRVSRDQYQGVMLGMSLAYEATTDPALRQMIRADVVALAEQLMRRETRHVKIRINGGVEVPMSLTLQHVVYTDDETEDGTPILDISTDPLGVEGTGMLTFWPEPSQFIRQIPGLGWVPDVQLPTQAIQLAATFRVALQVSADVPGFEDRHAALRAHYLANVDRWLDLAADWRNSNNCGDSYHGINIAFMPLYNWVRLENDPLRQARLQQEVLRDALWAAVANHKNVFFAFIYASQAAAEDPLEAIVGAHLGQLALFGDPPQLARPIDLTAKYPEDPSCPGLSSVATDVDERPGATFIWQHQPWQRLDAGTPLLAYAGLDYLLAYWLGRHAGFICEDLDLRISDQTVTAPVARSACNTIRIGPRTTVGSGGALSLRAGREIRFETGFRVHLGGQLRAGIAPLMGSAAQMQNRGTDSAAQANRERRARPPATSRQAPAPDPPRLVQGATQPNATPLTWSQLPAPLQRLLFAHGASIAEPQADQDRRQIVFATDASLLWEDDNQHGDIYRYSVASQRFDIVSLGSDGRAGDGASHSPRLDASGQRIVFVSSARNLTARDTFGASQLYLYDPKTPRLTLLSSDLNGKPGSADSDQPVLGGDWLFFRTDAHDLGPEGPGLYRQHLADDWRQLIGVDDWGTPDPLASHPAVDAHGETLAYQRPDVSGAAQIYLSNGSNAARLSDPFQQPALSQCCATVSADGAFVAYREATADGRLRLRVAATDCGVEASLPWPTSIGKRQQPPLFGEDGAVIGWINPLQGPDQPSWLALVDNPLYPSSRCWD